MSSKVWFITGATRGLGKEFVNVVLKAGDKVVATGRKQKDLDEALDTSNENLLTVVLDVTLENQIQSAVKAAIDRFGRIDVLVNNAGYGHLGVFEEATVEEIQHQYATNVFGLMSVTRAIIPLMRKQRSGYVFNISSVAGLRGGFGATLYCSAKFAVEGFSQALAQELAPFGVHVTVVSPGFFRTDFLASNSVQFTNNSIDDYVPKVTELQKFYESRNHNQLGDPEKLGEVLIKLTQQENPPVTFVAGSDAVQMALDAAKNLEDQVNAFKELSSSTDGKWE
jgi:NAD(P)-dependent dehydrogenase (short-subunit alcohol dehydrogenase family)